MSGMGGILVVIAILFVLVVLVWLNANMVRCRVCWTPRGAEGNMDGVVVFGPSSHSGEGEGGSELMR